MDEAVSHQEYTSKGYLEPHNSHPFQLQSQIVTKLKYFPNIGEPHALLTLRGRFQVKQNFHIFIYAVVKG